jgi:UDPglucose 6-dehydrogenase
LKGVIAVNDQQFERVVQKVVRSVQGEPAETTIAIWGLTFKAGTDDLRDSPSLEIVKRLLAKGFKVQGFDPTVVQQRIGIPDNLKISLSPIEVTVSADVLLVLTEWDDFKWISPSTIAISMAGKQIIDARNLLDRKDWERAGFTYQGIGR